MVGALDFFILIHHRRLIQMILQVLILCVWMHDVPPGTESFRNKSPYSFHELLSVPKRKRKTAKFIRRAINSRGTKLKKIFSTWKNLRHLNRKGMNHETTINQQANWLWRLFKYKQQQPSKKKTLKTTEAESRYLSLCQEDMWLCIVCVKFYHEKCGGRLLLIKTFLFDPIATNNFFNNLIFILYASLEWFHINKKKELKL